MRQTLHAVSVTEDGSTAGGFALIDLGRKILCNPVMLSFRRVDRKPRYLGPNGWHREVCWWEAERIGESDLSTIVRVGPAVVDRISELEPIDPPPLKWSDLRYVFDIQEDCNGKEAIQA